MGILESLQSHEGRDRKKYKKEYGEKAQAQLSRGFGINTLPHHLNTPMYILERWIESSAHFRNCVHLGLSGQEELLEKIGLNMAAKNKGNYKAWEALCRVKLGWKLDHAGNSNSSGSVDVNVSVEED